MLTSVEKAVPVCRASDFIKPEVQTMLGLKSDTILYAELAEPMENLPKSIDTLSTLGFMSIWQAYCDKKEECYDLKERVAALEELLKQK